MNLEFRAVNTHGVSCETNSCWVKYPRFSSIAFPRYAENGGTAYPNQGPGPQPVRGEPLYGTTAWQQAISNTLPSPPLPEA